MAGTLASMSLSATQRAHQWGQWIGRHEVQGWVTIGFEHHCGAATLFTFTSSDQWHDISCSGCRFEIGKPLDECEPLYRPRPAALAQGGPVKVGKLFTINEAGGHVDVGPPFVVRPG